MPHRYNGENDELNILYKGCMCFGLLAILVLSIVTTVGVFRTVEPNAEACFGDMTQPQQCDPEANTCPPSAQTCCHGICRDLDFFAGVCEPQNPITCTFPIDCPTGEFCCKFDIQDQEGTCRPFDWPGQCEVFVPKPTGRCDPGGIGCLSGDICCNTVCRDPNHPACKKFA